MRNKEFKQSIDFIVAVDGLKKIFRQTKIIGADRYENDAEHSWHICVMAYTLANFFDDYQVNIERAVKMLVLHDIVELHAGDTYCYNAEAQADKLERELASAKKVFGLLPESLRDEFMSLWLEFDEEKTDDAIFASIMDKIQPLILNFHNNGEGWYKNDISRTQVMGRMKAALEKGPEPLREYVLGVIEKSVENGWLKRE